MQKIIVSIIVIFFLVGGTYLFYRRSTPSIRETQRITETQSHNSQDVPAETVIAEGLDTPWALAFLPNHDALVTERPGSVRLIRNNQLIAQPVATIASVKEIGEGGLLGIALHPDFSTNRYVYLYYTYSSTGENTRNRVVRMKYIDGILHDEEILVDNIPGASNHNGGRIKFGPDRYLYITTGDAQEPSQAQDKNSLAGKILRVTDDGKPAPDNPFHNRTYSYGHRNPQGITWDSQGRLWATEHGRSGLQSGLDELNLISAGKNYGWPDIQGDETRVGMETPKANSGSTTWAPAGLAFRSGFLYFGGLRGKTLYKAMVTSDTAADIVSLFSGDYGRIREVVVGPDAMLYISTSNRDGRGIPSSADDRIIRINPDAMK